MEAESAQKAPLEGCPVEKHRPQKKRDVEKPEISDPSSVEEFLMKNLFFGEKRESILRIKNRFCRHPEFRKRFNGMDIYRSVIEDNIKSEEEFIDWLEEEKGILVR